MIWQFVYAFVVGFAFVFVAGCRTLFMVRGKYFATCLFSWLITITWVTSANVATSSPWYVLVVFGAGCMFGNILAMLVAGNRNNSKSS